MTQRDAQKGLKQGVSVGIGTRNVIAFRCRERYFGEISGLNRRSISIATSTSRSAHTHMVFACQSESPYDEMLPEQRIRYPSAPKIGETREISTPSLPSVSPPLSPLRLRFVCRARKRGRHEGGRKRATAFFFRIDRRNRKDTNGSKFRRYLVKLLIDRTSSIELKSGHRWEGRWNEVIPLVKLSRGLRGG